MFGVLNSIAFVTFVAGLTFGLSLIVAIGPQNSFVIRQGAMRQHVGTVVAICSVSDIVLIVLGVAGAGAAFRAHPSIVGPMRIAGATFLVAYALLAARRAVSPTVPVENPACERFVRRGVIAACLAFTWLNPAVYLDTIVLLGSVANSRSGHQWWFGAGAALGSVLWFVALGYGSRVLTRVLRNTGTWRILDGCVAAVMALTAVRLIVGV